VIGHTRGKKNRAPSGPVKVSVPTQPQERPQLWHLPMSLHQFADLLYKQLDHRRMFTQWSLDLKELAERAVFQKHTLLKLRFKNTRKSSTSPAGSSDDVPPLILQHFAPSTTICGRTL